MPRFAPPVLTSRRGFARVARTSLSAAAMVVPGLALTGCIVTDAPTFLGPERTAPRLVSVSPEPSELIRVPTSGPTYDLPSLQFQILSEDAGQRVDSRVVIDYGLDPANDPGFDYDLGVSIAPGRLSDGPRPKDSRAIIDRKLSRLQYAPTNNDGRSCRTVTLIVSHEFRSSGERYCPVDLNDADWVTWFVALCPGSDASEEACPVVGCPAPAPGASFFCGDTAEEVAP